MVLYEETNHILVIILHCRTKRRLILLSIVVRSTSVKISSEEIKDANRS